MSDTARTNPATTHGEKPHRRVYKKGEKILRPHDEPTKIYTIISGYVKSYSINDQGVEQIQIIYGHLEVFPVAWFAGSSRIRMYFEAMTDCVIDVLPKEALMASLNTKPEVGYLMLTKVTGLFLNYIAQVNNLEHTYASERVAYQLLILADRFGETTKDGLLLPPFSYQTIGSLINLSRESVNREMGKFAQQGLLKITKNRIYLLNIPGLKKKIDRDGTNLIVDDLANMQHEEN